jgi:hypothetical protein
VAGDTLELVFDTLASDPEGDALTQEIQWAIDGTHMSNFDGKLTIGGKQVKGGATWTATVSVSDANNPAVEVSTSVTIVNQAPVVDSVAIDPASPSDSRDLTCIVNASDPDNTTLTSTYRWLKDGVEETSIGNSPTVPAASTSVGEVWTCEVTVSDGYLEAIGSASATILVGTKVIYARTLTATLTPDGKGGWSDMSGTTTMLFQTSGAAYGTNDCYAEWALVGTTKTRVCPGCDYDFTVTATYDSTTSVFNTSACSGLATNGTGELSYSNKYGSSYGELQLNGPGVPLYYYGSSYPGYSVSPGVMVGTNYYSSYGGYVRNYSSSATYDGYGNMLLDVVNYIKFYR